MPFTTVGIFQLIYAVVGLMVFSAAITSSLILLAAFCVATIFIAFLRDHGPVFVFLHWSICKFSGEINVLRNFLWLEGEQHSSSIRVSCFYVTGFDCIFDTCVFIF